MTMESSRIDLTKVPPKGLTFDVFGTVVNWRKTVTSTLISTAAAKTHSTSRSANLSPEIRLRLAELTDESWGEFAQQWRNSYKAFVIGYRPNLDPWKDIDTFHRESLIDLLSKWKLEGLYDENELEDLSKVWHFLEPWPDSSSGIHQLSKLFVTSTLSNGNRSLLRDLNDTGNLGFRMLQSSEDFKAYKPHRSVYLGGAKKIAEDPGDIAMVAAHLGDLKAARRYGLRTIYVERQGEEDWPSDGDDYKEARSWVDMWITQDEEGFLEVAKRFGIN